MTTFKQDLMSIKQCRSNTIGQLW